MYARPFNEFHNAGDEDVLAVAYGVYFNFLSADVFIHQNGFILIDFDGSL